jgi:hypothetical protein
MIHVFRGYYDLPLGLQFSTRQNIFLPSSSGPSNQTRNISSLNHTNPKTQGNILEELNLQQTAVRTSSVTTGQESQGKATVTYNCTDK